MVSKAQLARLRDQLRAKRQELKTQMDDLAASIDARADCSVTDSGDAASFLESRHRAAALFAHHEQTLREVDAALERMRSGEYGYDEDTGEPIARAKLAAVPWRRHA